jgi:fucose 4-O-acetylase-like acetyltransferase
MMIGISPFLIEVLRRKWGWICVLTASLSVFTWGLWHPWALAPAQPPAFPPVLWQAIFILGLLLGNAWPRYDALSAVTKSALAGASWLVAGCLFVMEYSYQWGMPQLSFGVAFVKTPLSTAEALRYLSIIFGLITTTDVLWRYIADTAAAAFVQTLGRKSLPVYALHLWVVEAMGALADKYPSMGAWQISMAFFSILVLWLWALILDVTGAPKSKHAALPSALPGVFRPEPSAGTA